MKPPRRYARLSYCAAAGIENAMSREIAQPVSALDGVRVADLTAGIAGAVAALPLGDFGAAVVRAEPPGGDPLRSQPGWVTWSRGKQSVTFSEDDDVARAAL